MTPTDLNGTAFDKALVDLLERYVFQPDDVAGVVAEMRHMATLLESDPAVRAEFFVTFVAHDEPTL